jgi:hypothetical protein
MRLENVYNFEIHAASRFPIVSTPQVTSKLACKKKGKEYSERFSRIVRDISWSHTHRKRISGSFAYITTPVRTTSNKVYNERYENFPTNDQLQKEKLTNFFSD